MVKSLARSKESAEEIIELFLNRQEVDIQITDKIAIIAARKIRDEEEINIYLTDEEHISRLQKR
jgi:hypothetical protein